MRHRDAGQPLVAVIRKQRDGALHEFLGGRAGQSAVQRVGLGQQRHVRRRRARSPHQAAGLPRLAHQAGQLLARVARHAPQIPQDHAAVFPPEPDISETGQGHGDDREFT